MFSEKESTIKYESLIESEIKKDEEGSGGIHQPESDNTQNIARFTLGDLLGLIGGSGDSAYVSLVSKLHELLGEAGKKGLDEEGKKAINSLVQDLNKFSPKIGPIIQRAIQQYGYDLDVEIPIEGALIGYFGFVAYRINSTRNELLKIKSNSKENNKGGEAWQ